MYEMAPFALEFLKKRGRVEQDNVQTIIVVVQPLVALMEDHVSNLKRKGLKAAYVGNPAVIKGVRQGKYNYVIGSPESFLGSQLELFQTKSFVEKMGLLVVDESHCIKKL